MLDHPYAEFLTRVSKPARYVGGEINQVAKDWERVDVRFVLAFPDVYDVGMSHLGTKILYTLVNRDPRALCERCFAPWPDMEAELRARGLPLLSLESARLLRSFDVVGFSLQYELTYTNVLLMLELGGIPLRSAERGAEHPLVIAGGPTATHPEPLAPFIDAFVIGDGEEKLSEVLHAWKECVAGGLSRREGLERLAELGGLYVPGLYDVEQEELTGVLVVSRPAAGGPAWPVRRAFLEQIDRYPFPQDAPVPHAEAVFDRVGVEVARGCTEGCRFCQAGMIYRPVRERDPESVLSSAEGALRSGGHDEVSFTSLSTADYSAVAPLVQSAARRFTPRKVSLSVSSLRAYGLPETVLDDLSEMRATGLTFAPEAGTQRMRDVISKNISDEDMERTAHRVFERGWDRIKLYFMLGLPSETDEDVEGIAATASRVREIGLQYHRPGRLQVSVSVSSHVPKPHTPFQWAAFDPVAELERKQGLLRRLARRGRFELKTHRVSISTLEAIIARGDRRLADVIEWAYRDGARFDGWEECFDFERWQRAFEATGVDRERYLGTLPVEARLAWDHIHVGLEEGFLLKEYRKALEGRLSPPCGKPFRDVVHHTNLEAALQDRRRLVCYDCGVACDLDAMRQERIGFLRKLGADRPREPRAHSVPREPRRQPPPPAFAQGERHQLRLAFSKLGPAALTGHLDTTRLLARCVRRAGLEPFYSQGFRPKPVMTFGPALSLGVQSLAEYADVALAEPTPAEGLTARLNAVAPAGLGFVAARALLPGDRKLARVTQVADYLIAVEAAELEREASESAELRLARGLAAALAKKGAVLAVTHRRGERRERDLHGQLQHAWLADGDPRAAELGFPPECRVIGLRQSSVASVRPEEALAALLGRESLPVVAVARVALFRNTPDGPVDPMGRSLPAGP